LRKISAVGSNTGSGPRETLKIRERPYALWIGVLQSHKRPLDMLEISEALPEMDFIMVGAPSDKQIVDRLVTEKPPNLHYLGSVSDHLKEDLIRKCSVGVTTSVYEGFGWTPLEFLSAGKPAVAYPLRVFREVYGDLVSYVQNVAGFIRLLREFYSRGFRMKIDAEAVEKVQNRYDFARAASRFIDQLSLESLVIFATDLPSQDLLDGVLGFYLVEWQFWRSLLRTGICLQIYSNGTKFSSQFGIADRTLCVGRSLLLLKRHVYTLRQGATRLHRLVRKILYLSLLLLEPWYYVVAYIRNRKGVRTDFVLGGHPSTLFAAIVLKAIYGLRIAFLIHDAGFYRLIWESKSFAMRIHCLVFTYCLRYVDHVTVVSKATANEFSAFYQHREKIGLLWGE